MAAGSTGTLWNQGKMRLIHNKVSAYRLLIFQVPITHKLRAKPEHEMMTNAYSDNRGRGAGGTCPPYQYF